MAEYICECVLCHVRNIKRSEMVEEVDYIRKGTKYYHMKCYRDWKESTPAADEEYKAFIYDFLSRDLKVSYDYHMIEAQLKKFTKENKSMKGIFFTLKYFYEIKKNDWDKGHGGIGIVPFVYIEACNYWVARERESNGIVAQIERQMREAETREKKVIVRQTKKKKKYEMDFDAIERMEDE